MSDDLFIPRLSAKEYLILDALVARGGQYGLELVRNSEGQLKRGTIYVTLGRMEEKGYVESEQSKELYVSGKPKRLYKPTGYGAKVFRLQTQGAASLGSDMLPVPG